MPGGEAQALLNNHILTYPQEVAIISGAPAAAVPTLASLYPPADFPNPDNNNNPSADEALSQIFTADGRAWINPHIVARRLMRLPRTRTGVRWPV